MVPFGFIYLLDPNEDSSFYYIGICWWDPHVINVHVPQPTQEAACDSDRVLTAQQIHHSLIPFVFAFFSLLFNFVMLELV